MITDIYSAVAALAAQAGFNPSRDDHGRVPAAHGGRGDGVSIPPEMITDGFYRPARDLAVLFQSLQG